MLVIGVGNEWRADDAAGIHVARKIARRKLPGVLVLEHSGEGTSLMEIWKGAESVILVDSIRSGAAPGTIRRFDVSSETFLASTFGASSHMLGVAEAIEMSRALHQLPKKMIVYGIEAKSFNPGSTISAEVMEGIRQAEESIAKELTSQSNCIYPAAG